MDDDAWMRRGRASWLAEADGLQVVASLSPQDALTYEGWAECDVALVDAWDESERFYRFPGVRVVERIRTERNPEQTVIIVVSGHLLDDMLRLRMAEAGADFFYGAAEVPDLESLVEVITRPADARRVSSGDPRRLAQWGLSTDSRPNLALHHIVDEGMEDAFAPGATQRQVPLSRRRIITARRRLAQLARLSPGRQPGARPLDTPEWRAVVRFVNWARGVEGPEDDRP